MQYGSGVYDVPRNYASSPVPRMRPEAYEIASRHSGSGMFSCLNQPKRNQSSTTTLNYSQLKGPLKFAGVRSPIATDPIYNEGKYSNRSLRPQPRVKPEAAEIADKSQGCMGILFANYGKPDPATVNNTIEGDIDPRASGPMKKAGIRGPILVDPIYKENYTGRTPRPGPRVKPEAAEIASKSQGVVAKLFVTSERRYDARPKTVPHPGVKSSVFPPQQRSSKDHSSENLKRMREIQKVTRQNHRPAPVKALWKSSNYDTIESRVKPMMSRDPPPPPRSNDHSNINFVSRNAKAAKKYEIRRSRSEIALRESKDLHNRSLEDYKQNVRGRTPTYLQDRQKIWEEEEQERARARPDPSVPEGHTVLPDQQRRETLSKLRECEFLL